MPDLSVRVEDPELMDTETVAAAELERTLGFLRLTAKRFGGNAVILDKLSRWCRRWPANATISILDVGTGGADTPVAIAEWARAAGRRVRIVAIDLVPDIAAIGRRNAAPYPEIDVRCADLFALARGPERFDYVVASLFLHHMPTSQIAAVLSTFDRLASRGVIVSDLSRSAAGYWAVTALSFLAGNRIVRHDGPLSVRRSFRAAELDSYAREAGLPYLRAGGEPWFRVSLSGEKS